MLTVATVTSRCHTPFPMNYLKLKYFDDKYGHVYTALPKCRHYRDVEQMTSVELAQLCCDLMSLQQKRLRPNESKNLFLLLIKIGYERYGNLFFRQVAIQFINSLGI